MKLLKNLLLPFLLLIVSTTLFSQTFNKVSDPNNPINTINLRGFYLGSAWADIDSDGDLDLSTEGWALRNEGQDSFTIVQSFGSAATGNVDFLGGVSWSDHDNDGDLDCLYAHTFQSAGVNSGNTIIYENDGNGNFTEKLIDDNQNLRTWSTAFGNYNNDAYTDVTCAVAFNFSGLSTPGFLYTGNEEGTFTEIDTMEFTQNTAPYTVAYWTDYDQDGDSDLLMAAGPGGSSGPDYHYRNLLTETGVPGLERITDEPFATDSQDGQCYNLIDHDLDGDLDLYLTNYGGAINRFYENQNGTFVSIANALVFPGPMLGNCWGDFDNDGDQDVLLTADNINLAGYFENQNGTFEKTMNPFQGEFTGGNVSGLTIGDYDNDGDLDFYANGGQSGQSGPRALFKNELSNDNHWIEFDLVGTAPSNRSAIGAQVRIKANINGQDRWLHREVSAQNTFMGHNALRVHFGTGTNTTIDSMRINWPSGNEEVFTNLAVDQLYTVTEGEDIINNNHELNRPIKQGNIDILPNPASGFCQIKLKKSEAIIEGKITISNLKGQTVLVTNTSSQIKEINLSPFANGIYQILWETENGTHLGRLVVE